MIPRPLSYLRRPMASLFGQTGAVRVIGELARHGGSLSTGELMAATRLARSNVAANLETLIDQGVVEGHGQGRSRRFAVRFDHPLVPEIVALCRAEDRRFHSILDEIRGIAENTGATAAWLYGSVARGEDRPGSDLDLAILWPDPDEAEDRARNCLRAVEDRQKLTISLVALGPADIDRLVAENDPWWSALAAEAIALTGPAPAAVAGPAPSAPRRSQ
ncbi:MAG: nucleotidyltransferase domain-containing protein [Azospirillaceae bacterium]